MDSPGHSHGTLTQMRNFYQKNFPKKNTYPKKKQIFRQKKNLHPPERIDFLPKEKIFYSYLKK